MIKKSKIVATIGPASQTREVITKMLENGADVFRFNLKHNTSEWHQTTIDLVKTIANELGKHVAIMIDIPKLEINIDTSGVDFVAISYIRSKTDLEELKRYLLKTEFAPKIIAKIENGEAIKNLEEILPECDGIMVARGDLGRELPLEQLAFWQKKIIEICRKNNKPVIVATQMLSSMVDNDKPTRAEATDVANAIFDGTDALMLSEETAIGKDPARVVGQMSKIAVFCDNEGSVGKVNKSVSNISEILVKAAVNIIEESTDPKIAAVVVFSRSGATVRKLSSYRLKIPLIAVTDNQKIMEMLNLSYGVVPFYNVFESEKFEIENPLFQKLTDFDFLNKDDRILVIHGNNWMTQGSTSDISLKTI